MKLRIRKNSLLSKLVIVAILLVIVLNILRYAAYFKKDDNSKLIVMIQNDTNAELVHDVYIDENNVIYFSEDDMKKYFDKELYYEKDEKIFRSDLITGNGSWNERNWFCSNWDKQNTGNDQRDYS